MRDEKRAHEDLAMIRRLLEDGRREVMDRGKHFIIWGLIPAVGTALTYGYVSGWSVPGPRTVWPVLLAAGWAGSFLVGWRDGRGAGVKTLARRLLTGVWVSVAITLTLLALAGMFGGVIGYEALPGMLSVVIAAPVFVTMLLTGERWLGLVAAGWWLGGGVMLFVPGPYIHLLMGAMSFVLLAVPGIVLNVRARRLGRSRSGRTATDAA